MKIKSILWLTILHVSGFLYAQTEFRPGYIIKITGDTVWGEIDYRDATIMGGFCKFRTSVSGDAIDYLPSEILGFRFPDSKYYISREVGNKTAFLEFLIKAKVNIYYLKDETGEHYYLDTEENPRLIEIPYKKEIKYQDNKPYLISSTRHIGLLHYYMQDAPGIESQIATIKKPDHGNLIKLARDYHNMVCKEDEVCIVYEKKLSPFRLYVEPVIGVMKYKNYEGLVTEFGGNVYLWIPGSNERFYLKTGILRQIGTGSRSGEQIFRIPLQIQYIYPGKRLKPRVGLGMDFYKGEFYFMEDRDPLHTMNVNAGLNYKLNQTFSLSGVMTANYTPNLLPSIFGSQKFELISYAFSAGLFIKL